MGRCESVRALEPREMISVIKIRCCLRLIEMRLNIGANVRFRTIGLQTPKGWRF
jgi:hypothetical protein